jgi:hypothetical protein
MNRALRRAQDDVDTAVRVHDIAELAHLERETKMQQERLSVQWESQGADHNIITIKYARRVLEGLLHHAAAKVSEIATAGATT